MTTIPKHWQTKKLGEVLTLEYGKGMPKHKRTSSGDVNVYGSNGIVGKHSESLVKVPCLIVGRKGTVGAVHLSTEPCWPIDTTYYVIPPENINLKFAYHLLGHLRLGQLDRSTAIPGLNRNDAYAKIVGVPELDEQKQIVDKLEELFSILDTTKTVLKETESKSRLFQFSFIGNAYLKKGAENKVNIDRLSAEIKEFHIHKTGQDIARRMPNISIKLPGLPNNMLWVSAYEICQSVRDGTHDTPRYVDSGIPLVTSKNLTLNGLDMSKIQYISKEDHKEISKRSSVAKGDILYGMIGTIGNAVLIEEESQFSIKNVGLFKVNPKYLNSEYLLYWLKSNSLYQILKANNMLRGTTQQFIPLGNLRLIPVPYTSLENQVKIVEYIKSQLTTMEQLTKALEIGVRKSEIIRQSVLSKAFSGGLN